MCKLWVMPVSVFGASGLNVVHQIMEDPLASAALMGPVVYILMLRDFFFNSSYFYTLYYDN